MASLLHLPAPLPPTSLTLGQLITDPLSNNSQSHTPSIAHDEINCVITAQKTALKTLTNPTTLLSHLANSPQTLSFLRKTTLQGKPIYLVTALETSQKPTFSTTAPSASVRRVDSASDIQSSSSKHAEDESIVAVGLREVKCKVEDREAPHALEDIGFEWEYYEDGEEDGQMAVGLGGVLSKGEGRGDVSDRGRKQERMEEDSGEEGIGGF
ncbi:hypothetical protein COCC4DRAFT_33798 [Bipolaris maydis ATCC 48331]|uniref:Uncharacterized protein n=2 Tax=Cochliobolus heterostrophus TaxID=5016 RepID=M2UMW0_COCH5|nr:uncharacterized protein COCC4DRAFT_33798 [Bipolaris maydis ATCC 48331]EMD94941.1 hypothetical protein COCHEDRAFT_1019851 [Bipolaris maydis C5]KAH7555879.1 hypothetical protein BM1_06405 [Bipolaris maydis]ENI01767.1 hypothetical protein COCC4DRAFT_33798 [Bipolaris maydis ATCC 48331]KAJ5029338.1 hypothetical protein J3E73DRAFT_284420 [Bipolaris maydis]KAJ5061925.1 hypothetical protein J3E74DRAFT_331422 [Bipolaris maydis]